MGALECFFFLLAAHIIPPPRLRQWQTVGINPLHPEEDYIVLGDMESPLAAAILNIKWLNQVIKIPLVTVFN